MLSETKVLLQEEVNSLHNKLEKLCECIWWLVMGTN